MNIKLLRNRTRLLMFGLVSVVTAYSFSSFKNCTTAEGMPQNNSPVVAQLAEAPVANTAQDIANRAQQITDLFEGIINDGMQSPGYDSLGSAAPVVDVPVVEKPQTPTVDDKAQNVAAAPATKAEGDNVTVTVKPGEDGKATVKAELDKRGASENESVSDSSAASEATVSELGAYKKFELKKFVAVVKDFAGVKDDDSKGVFDRKTRKGFIKKISSAKDGEVESLKSVIKNAVSKMSNINGLGDVVRPLQGFLENLLDLKDLSEDKKSAIEKELENFGNSLSSVKDNVLRRTSVLGLVKNLMEGCAKLSVSENLRNGKFGISNSLYSNVNDLIDIVTRLNNQSQLNPAIIDFLFLSKYLGSSYGKTGKMLDIYRQYIFDFGSGYNGDGCLVLSLLRNILSAKENGGVFSSNRNKLDAGNFSLRGYRHVNNNRDVIQIESQEDAERIVSGLFSLLTNLTKPLSGRALKSMNIPEEVADAFDALVSERGKTSSSSYRVIDFIRDYSLLESVLIRVLSQAFEKNSLGTQDAIQLNSIYQGSFESVDSIKKMYFDRKGQSSSVALETPGNSGGYGIGKFSQYDIYKFLTGTSADSISAGVSSKASGGEKYEVNGSALLPAFGGKMLLTGKAAARAIMAYAGLTPASNFVWPMFDISNEFVTNKGKDPFWTRLRREFGVNQKIATNEGFQDYNEAFSCLAGDINSLYVGSYNNILNSEPVEAFKNMSEEPFNTTADVGEYSTFSEQLKRSPWSMVYFSSKNPKAAEKQGFLVGGDWAAYGISDEARQNLKVYFNGLLFNSASNSRYVPNLPVRIYPFDLSKASGPGPFNAQTDPFPYITVPAVAPAFGLVMDQVNSGQSLSPVFMRPFKQNSQKSVDFAFNPFTFQNTRNSVNYLAQASSRSVQLNQMLNVPGSIPQVESLLDIGGTPSLGRVVKQKPGYERSNQEVVAKWFSLIKDKKFLDVLNRFRGNITGLNEKQGNFAGIRNFGYEFLPGNEEIDSNLRRQHVGRDVEIGSEYSRQDKFDLASYFKFDSDRSDLKKELDNSYYSIHSQKFASDSPHFFATLVDLYSADGIIGGYQSGGLAKAFKDAGFDVEFGDMALVYKLLSGVLSDGTDKDGMQSADDYSGLKDLLF